MQAVKGALHSVADTVRGISWVPSNADELLAIERQILQKSLPSDSYAQHVVSTATCELNTVSTVHADGVRRPHVILLHGFGSGSVQWVANWAALANVCHVHAIDMPGFGRSGRPDTAHITTCDDAIRFFTRALEQWCEIMARTMCKGANNCTCATEAPTTEEGPSHHCTPPVVVIGHSFGGYVAAKFAAAYPHRVRRVVLVDAFGVANRDPAHFEAFEAKAGTLRKATVWAVERIFYDINPLSLVRGAGPLGPRLVRGRKGRKMHRQFAGTDASECAHLMAEYVYHCAAQPPSGESVFTKTVEHVGLRVGPGFRVKAPIGADLAELECPVHFICGAKSWIPSTGAFDVVRARAPAGRATTVHVLDNAGHHPYVEANAEFNRIVTAFLRQDVSAGAPDAALLNASFASTPSEAALDAAVVNAATTDAVAVEAAAAAAAASDALSEAGSDATSCNAAGELNSDDDTCAAAAA